MDLTTIVTDKYEARKKWHDYQRAYKKTKNPMDRDMAAIYNQAKKGHKIINIFDVIKQGGNRREDHETGWHPVPNLAIAKANIKKVNCIYKTDGTVIYKNHDGWITYRNDITLENCLPTYEWEDKNKWRELNIAAPVPIIPAGVWNAKITDSHYILWHVDKWTMVPSADPYLLKRITKTLFIILAHWDLTPLELAVMKAYVK